MRDPQFGDYLALHRMCGEPAPVLPHYSDAELHPSRLLTGLDLIDLGYPQGPLYSQMLGELEDAQLQGLLSNREEAVRWLRAKF